MRSKLFFWGILCLTVSLVTCGGKSKAGQGDDKMKKRHYFVQGERLYRTYCANCHQKKGQGFKGLYPPLAQSDYLMKDLKRAACVVKNGIKGEIIVNGVTYNQLMPPVRLSDLEIAEIMTYITNSWGNEAEFSDVKKVSTWLTSCNANSEKK